jgi:phosphoglucosamine mutase
MILNSTISSAPWPDIKPATAYTAAVSEHIERIAADFPAKIRSRVVLDCGCGAASVITPGVLRRLGCEVTTINCHPSGFFPRNAEPTAENLRELIKTTGTLGADLGIAHDGDADRMMAIDDKARFIPGDKLLIILANSLGAQELVTTLDASMVIEETGLKVRRTRIGDPYVSRELKRNGDFGGEPSGSWIFPEVSFCPDGIYAAAALTAIASEKGLSSLADAIPAYPIIRGSLPGDSAAMAGLDHRLMEMKPKEVNRTDGLKLEFDDGWLLVRPSGTEPKIRITAEAKSQARAQEFYDLCRNIINKSRKGGG